MVEFSVYKDPEEGFFGEEKDYLFPSGGLGRSDIPRGVLYVSRKGSDGELRRRIQNFLVTHSLLFFDGRMLVIDIFTEYCDTPPFITGLVRWCEGEMCVVLRAGFYFEKGGYLGERKVGHQMVPRYVFTKLSRVTLAGFKF